MATLFDMKLSESCLRPSRRPESPANDQAVENVFKSPLVQGFSQILSSFVVIVFVVSASDTKTINIYSLYIISKRYPFSSSISRPSFSLSPLIKQRLYNPKMQDLPVYPPYLLPSLAKMDGPVSTCYRHKFPLPS